jgi:hypothetical protein
MCERVVPHVEFIVLIKRDFKNLRARSGGFQFATSREPAQEFMTNKSDRATGHPCKQSIASQFCIHMPVNPAAAGRARLGLPLSIFPGERARG